MRMRRVNRDLIVQLLADTTLPYREIARQADCSDWTVRSIAKQLDDFWTYDSEQTEPLSTTGFCTVVGIGILIVVGVCVAAWRLPPIDRDGMQ
jgi:hypothetical protein